MDIILVVLLTLISIPVVELTQGLLRIVIGIVVLLIFPGYSLTAALFPTRRNLSGIERAGLSLVLSFAMVSLCGLALNYTPWGIRLTPIIVASLIIILVPAGVAVFRRKTLREEERFRLHINIGSFKLSSLNRVDVVLSVALVLVVIGSLFTLGYTVVRSKGEEAFTNFYILGPEGKMENYPSSVTLGDQVEVTLGIENHENRSTAYKISIMLDGQEIQTISPLIIEKEDRWSEPVFIRPSRTGDSQKVEFFLYKNQETTPYLNLRLWLDVK